MNTADSTRGKDLFFRALDLPAGERTAFLELACGPDTAVRQRVESLLRAHSDLHSFLEKPAAAAGVTLRSATVLPEETAGDRIGRYKLLQKLGEGGCGVVYMAEQEEPVRRRVALKVIKLGMDTREVIARFEAERQALAMMDHPNIARVLDADATDTGRPYFVMELVRGIKITDYCDQNNLPTADRLNLFTQVCHAVQHAHQKGIIHRDLKPSNILVTLHDGVPVPKVIDFGIAKATQGRLTDKTVFTTFEQFLGTPAYMSPEQAEMSGLDIDTRSDIYSLGVLLYELLTGHTPFDAKELAQAGLDEMRRRIREMEPPKPSTRLSTMTGEALTVAANHRQIASAKLLNLIRGDLDWIVMRCLEKDRTRRYETANSLADDIRRHLTNEPVSASPPSTAYLLQKLVRRHQTAFTAAAAVAAALVLGAAAATWQAVRATRAEHRIETARQAEASARARAEMRRAEAEAARALAERRRTEVETINKLLLSDSFASTNPEFARGRDITVREVLDNAAARIPHAFADNPLLEAAIRATIGETYFKLTVMEKAETHLQAALATRRRLLGEEHPDTLAVLRTLGALRVYEVKTDEGEAIVQKVIAIQERTLGADHEETLKSLSVLFDLREMGAEKKRPVAEWKRVIAELEELARANYAKALRRFGPDHPVALAHQQNLLSSVNLAVMHNREKLKEADPLSEQLLAARRRVLGPDHPDTFHTMEGREWILNYSGRTSESEKRPFGLDKTRETLGNLISESRLRASLALNTPEAFKIFGGAGYKNDPATLDSIRASTWLWGRSTLEVWDARVSGEDFSLPTGPVGVGFYAEVNWQKYSQVNDPLGAAQDDLISLSRFPDPTWARRTAEAAAAEVHVPLVTREAHRWLYNSDLAGAVRFDNFSDGYNSGFKPYFGLRVQPVQRLTLRASVARTFSAQSLQRLYGGSYDRYLTGLPDLRRPQAITGDPYDGTTTSRLIRNQGSPHIQPTHSSARQVGFVYDVPGRVFKGLTVGATWFRLEADGIPVNASNITEIRTDELGQLGDMVVRDPGTETYTNNTNAPINILSGPNGNMTTVAVGQTVTVPGRIRYFDDTFINYRGGYRTENWDFKATYTRSFEPIGRVRLGSNVAYVVFHGEGDSSLINMNRVGRDYLPRMKMQSSILWLRAPWSAGLTHTYISAHGDLNRGRRVEVDPHSVYGATVSRSFRGGPRGWFDGTRLMLGVDNLLDRDPSLYYSATGYLPQFARRPAGRFFYAEVRKTY